MREYAQLKGPSVSVAKVMRLLVLYHGHEGRLCSILGRKTLIPDRLVTVSICSVDS